MRLTMLRSGRLRSARDGEQKMDEGISKGGDSRGEKVAELSGQRLLKYYHGVGSSRFNSIREERRRADGALKHIQDQNALKEAVGGLISYAYKGIVIDSHSYVDILRKCSKQKDFELVKQVHECIKKSGLEQNPYVANNLLKCYIECGRLQKAQELFNKLVMKNIVSWNTMIGGYAEWDQAEAAIDIYKQLINRGGQPGAITYLTVLKACASSLTLNSGKNVHAHIVHNGYEADLRVGTALVSMYAKCGSINDARAVFNRMERRDVVGWNAMISGLAHHGHGREAFSSFQQMQREGFTPDATTYLCLLGARADAEDLAWVKKVHSHATRQGFAQHLSVNNALIFMYAKCGSMDNAKLVFESMIKRDVISWNTMMGGLARHGRGHEAFLCFHQMQREGFVPNAVTYMNILNSNASAGALAWVKDIHDHVARSEVNVDVRVNNALVHMYTKSGSIEDARVVFDEMEERDVTSWNIMIDGLAQHGLGLEAFSLFLQMEKNGFVPDSYTYVSILNSCASTCDLERVKEVHAHAMRAGLDVDLRVGTALVHNYAKCGNIKDARALFDRMEERDVICWNMMIGGLAQHGLGHEAFSLFLHMEKEGFAPDSITYVSILNPCSSIDALGWVKEVHAHAMKAGLDVNLRVGNALVHMYAKSGSIEDARKVFDRMEERDVVSWNVMIGGLAQHGLGLEAFSLFHQMGKQGLVPDWLTYVSILDPCSSTGALEWVKDVHSHAMKASLDVDLRVGTSLVHMYAKIGSIADARQVFHKMPDRDVVTWTAIIGGHAQHGHGREALHLFEEMKAKGGKANGPLFVAVLSACSHAGLVDEGRFQLVSMMRDYGIEPALDHYTCMVDILGRGGHLEEAKLFIANTPIKPNVVTWMALLGASRTYSAVKLAERAATECVKLEPTDPSPYVLLSNIYAAAGKWDQVSSIRNSMQERGYSQGPRAVLD